jgi:hypothetical protein
MIDAGRTLGGRVIPPLPRTKDRCIHPAQATGFFWERLRWAALLTLLVVAAGCGGAQRAPHAGSTTQPTTTQAAKTVPLPPYHVVTRPKPPAQDPLALQIDRALRQLRLGLAFNAPTSLRQKQSAVIHLIVSVRQTPKQLKPQVPEAGSKEGARVRLSDEMIAHLTGLGFNIDPLTPEQQLDVLPTDVVNAAGRGSVSE